MNTASATITPCVASRPHVAAGTGPAFGGVVVPLATPLAAVDSLDVGGLGRLVEHVIAGGVHGIFVLGTTGEGPSLSHETQRSLVREVMRQVGDRVPVFVGITDPSFAESVALADWAAAEGAAAVVAAPPFYFAAAQEALVGWMTELADRVPLPLLLYHSPEMTKAGFTIDSLRALADCPNIVGLKDSSGDMDYFAAAMAVARNHRPDWSMLMGTEMLFPRGRALGCHGVVPGGANVCPRVFADMHAALVRGDGDAIDSLQAEMQSLGRLYSVGTLPGRVVVGIKAALAELGICSALAATPFERLTPDQHREVRAILATLKECGA
jgi:4-hydroxy-tetrahydrodipicolinate synthase